MEVAQPLQVPAAMFDHPHYAAFPLYIEPDFSLMQLVTTNVQLFAVHFQKQSNFPLLYNFFLITFCSHIVHIWWLVSYKLIQEAL